MRSDDFATISYQGACVSVYSNALDLGYHKLQGRTAGTNGFPRESGILKANTANRSIESDRRPAPVTDAARNKLANCQAAGATLHLFPLCRTNPIHYVYRIGLSKQLRTVVKS